MCLWMSHYKRQISKSPFRGNGWLQVKRLVGDLSDIENAVDLIVKAERPFIYAGGGVILSDATSELTELAEYLGIPVGTTLSGKGAINETHPLSVGSTGFWGTSSANEVALQSDLILAIGTKFSEFDTGLWNPKRVFPIPPSKLIHIDIDPQEIGRNYPVKLVSWAMPRPFCTRCWRLRKRGSRRENISIQHGLKRLKKVLTSGSKPSPGFRTPDQVPIRLERVYKEIRDILPANGIIVSDTGGCKYGVAHIPFYEPRTNIPASGFATMGFAPGAAIGAKLGQPERPVIVVVGDGAFSSVCVGSGHSC